MKLDDGLKAQIMEMGRALIKEAQEEHIKTCPWGQKMVNGWKIAAAAIIAFAFGCGLSSDSLAGSIIKLFT